MKLAGLFLFASPILYWLLGFTFSHFFITGATAFLALGQYGFFGFSFFSRSIFIIYPGIFLFFLIVAKKFEFRLNWRIYCFSALFFLGAFPMAIICLKVFEPSITPDAIHAIKSGYLFPFMVIGSGLPFLSSYRGG